MKYVELNFNVELHLSTRVQLYSSVCMKNPNLNADLVSFLPGQTMSADVLHLVS